MASVFGYAALAKRTVHRSIKFDNTARTAAGVGILQIRPNCINLFTLLLRPFTIELSTAPQPRQCESRHCCPDEAAQRLVVVADSYCNIEIEEKEKEDGKEQAYIEITVPEVKCLSCLGINSKLMAASIEPIIIIAVLQLNDRINSNPYFSYTLSSANPIKIYCQKNTLFSEYFFLSYLKYSSGGMS
jgi:hypothetical protein